MTFEKLASREGQVDPHLFVILGGTGDLSQRKLLPALYALIKGRNLKDACWALGVGTKDIGDRNFRQKTKESLRRAGFSAGPADSWCASRLSYQPVREYPDGYQRLAERIREAERDAGLPGNRVFYLALPPSYFPEAIRGIGQTGLSRSGGWVRIVIEKPFGRDLASSRSLNRLLDRYFKESQIFRIDHYLGKETVQNLLFFRFANTIFESLWNRDRIESVEITVAESVGIERRGRYYEQAGALRDIVQNHLTQLLTLMTMEAPALFEPDYIRNEKVKILHSLAALKPVSAVFGQYTEGRVGGKSVPGYRNEPSVSPSSTTETYAALRLHIDNWRWQGVPFYLRTGKRLAQRLTQIVVNFRRPPVWLFKTYKSLQLGNNKLLLTLQPHEGFHLTFDVKEPGEPLRLKTESLHFHYADAFGRLPEAYLTLILDILAGDQTLFVRSDEVESAWRVYAPLLDKKIPVHPYPAGSWGPQEVGSLIIREGQRWTNLSGE
jgi:glucose-6-phosphate 1-dehydrogenase